MKTRRQFFGTAAASAAGAAAIVAGGAKPSHAADLTLNAQSGFPETSLRGRLETQWAERVGILTNGRLEIKVHHAGAVVKAFESFDAVLDGVLDIDMTGASYLTGKDPAFQFPGDLMGGYNTTEEFLAWFEFGGGKEISNELFAEHNMHLVGLWVAGTESMSSTRPIAGPADLKGWKFRSPPGMSTEIFSLFGASPIVMPFTEVFTSLSTGAIEGADAGMLNVNSGLGIHDLAKHVTYPGIHSMPTSHVSVRKDVWDSMDEEMQTAVTVAHKAGQLELVQQTIIADRKTLSGLPAKGVKVYDWSLDDRKTFRKTAREVWEDWATRSPMAKKMYESNVAFMETLGLL